jgi:hypothetical protein
MTAYRGSSGIAPLIHNLGSICGSAVKFKPRPLYPRERNPVPSNRKLARSPNPSGRSVEDRRKACCFRDSKPSRKHSHVTDCAIATVISGDAHFRDKTLWLEICVAWDITQRTVVKTYRRFGTSYLVPFSRVTKSPLRNVQW